MEYAYSQLEAGSKRPTHEDLIKAAEPLHAILCEYYQPHAMVIVQQNSVEIVIGEMGAPLPVPD